MKRQQKIGVLSALIALAVGSFGALQMAQAMDYTAGNTITIDSSNGLINVKNMAIGQKADKTITAETKATGTEALAWGVGADASGNYSIAIGSAENTGLIETLTQATGKKAVAIGTYSRAKGNNSTAVGSSNVAAGAGSTAIGQSNDVGTYGTGKQSTAVGYYNTVYANQAIGMGHWNYIYGDRSSAVGSKNSIYGKNSGAFGIDNVIGEEGEEANPVEGKGETTYVIGSGNTVTANDAFVLGSGVNTVANNSVVLGKESASTEENTVSVGNANTQRRIVNVANGTKEHEAATWDQLINGVSYNADTGELKLTTNNSSTYKTWITTSGSGDGKTYQAGTGIEITDPTSTTPTISVKTDGKVESGNAGIVTGGVVYDAISDMTGDTEKLSAAGLGDNVTDSILSVNDKVGNLSNDIHKVGAGAAALAALHPEGFDPSAKWSFAVGYGHYKNANAGAFGAFFQPNADTTLSLGSTIGNGSSMLNAGLSFKLGQRSAKLPQNASNPQLVQEVNALRAENAAQAQEIRELKAQMARVLAKIGG